MVSTMNEMDTKSRLVGFALGLLIGCLVFYIATANSYHVLAAPGIALALCAGMFAKSRRVEWGVITAVFAVMLCLLLEAWRVAGVKDESYFYFFTQLGEIPQRGWMNLGAAAIAGFWFGMGKSRRKRSGDFTAPHR